ncbi:MAG: hypothetical protein SGJ27_15675 [Candidatus Melainabacteria bacterium]|nr:hypothetical protein [Candidatus Melainabacteria bacterium]
MSSENEKIDDLKLRRKSEWPPLEPLSDSKLTAAQLTARELYRPRISEQVRSVFDSAGDLAALLHASNAEMIGSHAALKNLLSGAAVGLHDFSRYEISRGFAGGGNHYMLGAEFAIVAIIAIAGIAKRRTDLSYSEIGVLSPEDATRLKPGRGEVIYQSSKLGEGKMNFSHGLNQDVPDWLVSLDSSAAKEEGYLFGSVLTRPTVLITMSDTFVSLAETHFRDAVLAWLIVDLNRKKVTETWKGTAKVVAISNGETIELPVWEDIVEFYQSKPKNAKPDNLLTVVLKRNLDRELIEAALAAVVVPNGTNVDEADDGK